MNNAWFFGDSFTAGYGYNFEEFLDPKSLSFSPTCNLSNGSPDWGNPDSGLSRFKQWKLNLEKQIWPYLVSDYLGYKCINKGESGTSNERIIHNVVRYIKDIKEGDMVFLGSTIPSRTLTPFRNSPNEEGILRASMVSYDNGKPIGLKEEEDKNRTTIPPGMFTSKEKQVILDYIYYIYIQHCDIYNKYYKDRFDSIRELFDSMGVKTFYWDYTFWTSFETIREHTNNEVDDGHWSINGHKKFSERVIESINNGEYTLIESPDNTLTFANRTTLYK